MDGGGELVDVNLVIVDLYSGSKISERKRICRDGRVYQGKLTSTIWSTSKIIGKVEFDYVRGTSRYYNSHREPMSWYMSGYKF